MNHEQPLKKRTGGFWKTLLIVLAIILAVCLLCVGMIAVNMLGFFGAAFLTPTRTPFRVASELVNQVLVIPQSANGQVLLNDPRNLGLDQQGNIYAGNYDDGHIQVFDPTGKYLRTIETGSKTLSVYGMVVSPKGDVYVSFDGHIHLLKTGGDNITLPYDRQANNSASLQAIAADADGGLLAADLNGNLIRFAQDGSIKQVITTPFKTNLNASEFNIALAVDGAGNIYALGKDTWNVLKFDVDGNFVGQFGGKNRNHVNRHPDDPTANAVPMLDPGYFYFPEAIAVDRYGRIFVSDGTGNVQIFDPDGKYISALRVPDEVRAMSFDLNNNLYLACDTPRIIELTVTAP